MTWQQVAAQLAATGFPLLGRALGGQIPIIGSIFGGTLGETIGQQIAQALALALGVPATPEAVSRAIDKQPTSEVVSKLQGIEAEAAARWPALAAIAASDAAADVEIEKVSIERAKVNQETYRDNVRAEVAQNNFWMSLYRPVLAAAATLDLMLSWFGALYAIVFDPEMAQRLIDLKELYISQMGAAGVVLGWHFSTRMGERKAAIKVEPSVMSETTTTVVKK